MWNIYQQESNRIRFTWLLSRCSSAGCMRAGKAAHWAATAVILRWRLIRWEWWGQRLHEAFGDRVSKTPLHLVSMGMYGADGPCLSLTAVRMGRSSDSQPEAVHPPGDTFSVGIHFFFVTSKGSKLLAPGG